MPGYRAKGGPVRPQWLLRICWMALAAGLGAPPLAAHAGADHLLLSEVGVISVDQGDALSSQYIEVFNPTGLPIALDNYFLSDARATGQPPTASSYFRVSQGDFGPNAGDFIFQFPPGSTIPSGGVVVVCDDSGSFLTEFFGGSLASFTGQTGSPQLFEATQDGTADGVVDMITHSINANPSELDLHDTGEFVVLFAWNSIADLIKDADVFAWGTPTTGNSFPLKTGITVGSSTYLTDAGSNTNLVLATADAIYTRTSTTEPGETASGGNGITGHDESTENNAGGASWNAGAINTATPGTTPLTAVADAISGSVAQETIFGPIVSDAELVMAVQISNATTSTLALNVTGASIGGPDASRFSIHSDSAFPVNLAPGTFDAGSLRIRYQPNGSQGPHTATITLVSNDPANPSGTLTGQTIPDVADLAAALSISDGALIRITGTSVVTSGTDGLDAGALRHQLYVQDGSGSDGRTGLFIDDPLYALGSGFSPGDQIQRLVGTLGTTANMRHFDPATTATLSGTGAIPTPLLLTGGITDFETIEGELIRINGTTIGSAGVWIAGGSDYALLTPSGLVIDAIRIEDGSTAVGQTIPSGSFDVTGIAHQEGTGRFILPRFISDIAPNPAPDPAGTRPERWMHYE